MSGGKGLGGGGGCVWGEDVGVGIETMSCLEEQNLLLTSLLVKTSAGLTMLPFEVQCVWLVLNSGCLAMGLQQ